MLREFTKGIQAYNRYGFYQAKSPDEESYWTWDHTDVAFDGIHADTEGLEFSRRRTRTEFLLQIQHAAFAQL